ncbi:MAG: hypothetical protein ABI237_15665 [Ginsengibacter sp.]
MKKLVKNKFNPYTLLFLIATIIFAGCGKKDSDHSSDTDYYIKFTVLGKSYTFKGYPYATLSQADGIYTGGVGSFQEQGVGTKNVASILIGSLSSIKQETYSGIINTPAGGTTPAIFFAYIDENGKTFGSLYKDNVTNTVTITALSGTSIKGNFSGKIYDVLATNTSPINFSGDFNVKRVN